MAEAGEKEELRKSESAEEVKKTAAETNEEIFKVCARGELVEGPIAALQVLPLLEALYRGDEFRSDETEDGVRRVDVDPYLLNVCIRYASCLDSTTLLTKLVKEARRGRTLRLAGLPGGRAIVLCH